MEFKAKKAKGVKGKVQAPNFLPDPELVDPTIVDSSQITFYDDAEQKFMEREALRAKLRKGDGIVPLESDLEVATKNIYSQLALMKSYSKDDRATYLEL